MFKKIGALLVTILGIALLIYSATRSLDFISLTLPEDRQVLAWFGLAALDGGLIAWLLAYLYGSSGAWQRGISILMVLVDFIGAVAMFTLDTLYNTGKSGMTVAMSEGEVQTAVLALSIVIALNIAATVAHHLTDPDALKAQADEEARAEIEDLALSLVRQNSKVLATQVAPQIAADWMRETEAQYKNVLAKGRKKDEPLPALPASTPVQFASTAHALASKQLAEIQAQADDDGNEKPNPTPRSRRQR